VAVCWSNGFELNERLVEQGWATAYRSYSDAYVPHETRAKMARAGIWSSIFDIPQFWRNAQSADSDQLSVRSAAPRRARSQQAFAGGCVIKGNRNRRGEWIYHLPGMPYYNATRP